MKTAHAEPLPRVQEAVSPYALTLEYTIGWAWVEGIAAVTGQPASAQMSVTAEATQKPVAE